MGFSLDYLGLFEDNKNNCYVTEYSIHQTSLEQIFNRFDSNKGKKSENKENEGADEEEIKNVEIVINDDVYNSLLK